MSRALIIVLLVSLALVVGGVAAIVGAPNDTTYEYQFKTEQVEADAGYNGTAVPIEDLDEAQRNALFDAFKQTDHFLGGSSAYAEVDEPLDLSDDDRWRLISIEGVEVLVGVSGPETYTEFTFGEFIGMFMFMFGGAGVLMSLGVAKEHGW